MKKVSVFVLFVVVCSGNFVLAQEAARPDTLHTISAALNECPQVLIDVVSKDSLEAKAALFFINDSLHPLGRGELRDNHKPVKYLKVPIRMRRVTLLYVPPGEHQFHTIYMKKSHKVMFEPGKVYIAGLITTSVWPIPYAFVKEDRFGREFVPVLLMYITGQEADQMLQGFRNQEIIVAK